MKTRRILQWLVGFGLGLASIARVDLNGASLLSQLPADAQDATLPAQFVQALHAARERIAAKDNDLDAVRMLARLYHANRLFKEARVCYRVIAATPPGLTARDHYYLADIARNENDLAAAQTELRVVLETAPDYLPAHLALAEALFKSGHEDLAAAEYAAILARHRDQPQAAYGLARIELQRGEDDAAVARLEDLMASHPESTAGAALFAKVLERRGETDRAVAMMQLGQQKKESPPEDPWTDALLADCFDIQRLSLTFEEYFKLGRMDEAVPLLDRLAELDPAGPITKMFVGFSHAKALQHVSAIREYYESLAKGGDPEKVCPPLVQSLLALGKTAEAAGLLADYCAKLPESIPLAKSYADVAIRQGDIRLARTLLERILRSEPYLQPQNMSLASILWTTGERDAAAQCLRRVAAVYASDVPSRALLGEYYLGKGEPQSAIAPLEQARAYVTAKTPEETSLLGLLGSAYLQTANLKIKQGQVAGAADDYDRVSRLIPGDLRGYAGAASARVQLKQYRHAAAALEKMILLQPQNPTIYLSLGDVLYQDGDMAQASRQWQKALQFVAAGDTALRNALDERLSGRITDETFQ